MRIISLWGKADIGKTTTLTLLYNTLLQDTTFLNIIKTPEGICDFYAIFIYKGKKLGLTTYGDNKKCLKNSFDAFIENKCDIVICASRRRRTKAGSVKFIEELSKDITWIEQPDISDLKKVYIRKFKKNSNLINNLMVNYLLRNLDDAILYC